MTSQRSHRDSFRNTPAAASAPIQRAGRTAKAARQSMRGLALALLGSLALACSGGHSSSQQNDFRIESDGAPSLSASYKPSFLPLASSGRAEPEAARLSGVFPIINQRWVVLGAADNTWGVGKTRLEPAQQGQGTAGQGVLTLTRAVGSGQLPASLAQVAGSKVALGGPQATAACSATLGAIQVLRRLEPEFAGLDAEDAPKAGSAAFIKQAWKQGEGFGVLVAELQAPTCADAAYANFSTEIDIEVAERSQPDPDDRDAYRLAQQAFVGLHQLPEYQRMQKDYLEFIASPGADVASLADDSAWESHAAAQPELAFYGEGARRFVGWQLSAGEGCGDYYGNLSVLYEVVDAADGPTLRLVELNEAGDLPERVVLSGGGIQLVDETGVRQAGAERAHLPLEVPAFGCSC